jgi:hypothetical protein
MEQTVDVHGDFENTSGDVANAQRITTAEMENARIELGQQLIPVQEKWIGVQKKAVVALVNMTAAMNDADKESELLSRTLFENAKAAGKVTGEWEDLGKAGSETAEQASGWSKVWDVLAGRTRGLDKALKEVIGDTGKLTVAQLQSRDAYIAYAKGMKGVGAATDALAPKLVSIDRLTRIFSGDLFAAARNADKLKRSTKGIGALFAGGGGSGEKRSASGGPIAAGQATLVGERGPEVISTSRSGFVTPNHKLGGGGGNVYNINVTAIDPNSAAVAVVDAIRSFEDRFGAI